MRASHEHSETEEWITTDRSTPSSYTDPASNTRYGVYLLGVVLVIAAVSAYFLVGDSHALQAR